MSKKILLPIILLFVVSLFETSCNNCKSGDASGADSVSVDSGKVDTALPELKGDEEINKATRFYAGISKDGIEMAESDSKSWETYNQNLKRLLSRSDVITSGVDSIARTDFSDFRDKVDYVFYPFSGADFIYPTLFYPNADTYFMCGLEKTGTPITGELKTNYAHYEAYRNALTNFFNWGYFITKNMHNDMHNKEIDGVCPVIAMMMAIRGYEIISINYVKLNDAGDFVKAETNSNSIEIKFFKSGTRHEQTLYYLSGDVQNNSFDANLKKYLDKTLPNHTVGTYLKAASFLLHWDSFSTMRNYIVDNSISVIQDDTGVPYRYLKDNFDLTLYGKYAYPSSEFSSSCGQPDLEELFKKGGDSVHPLPFQMGYKNSRNLICARRKGGF